MKGFSALHDGLIDFLHHWFLQLAIECCVKQVYFEVSVNFLYWDIDHSVVCPSLSMWRRVPENDYLAEYLVVSLHPFRSA